MLRHRRFVFFQSMMERRAKDWAHQILGEKENKRPRHSQRLEKWRMENGEKKERFLALTVFLSVSLSLSALEHK